VDHGCSLNTTFTTSNPPSIAGSSRLDSLQYVRFITQPPLRPWLRPSQAKARPKPAPMAWPQDHKAQNHPTPSKCKWLPGQTNPEHHYSKLCTKECRSHDLIMHLTAL